jgi:hypothetical protein
MGEGVIGVAVAGRDATVLDGRKNAAGVGTVVGTNGLVGGEGHQLLAVSLQPVTRPKMGRLPGRQPLPKQMADG